MFSDGTYYGCCACIGYVGIGIAPHLVILKSENGFAVQLYESGDYHTKTPSGNTIQFQIRTDYPVGDTVRIQVDPEQKEQFALSLRIPSWSVENSLKVNGEPLDVTSGMTVIDRQWQAGDTVELRFDMRVEALRPTSFQKDFLRSRIIWKTCDMVPFVMEETPEHRHHAAFRRGPLILVRDDRLGNPDFERLPLRGVEDTYLPAQMEDASKLPFRALCCVTVFSEDERPVRLIDCASAGRTWDSSSSFTVWMKTNQQECD